MNKLHTLLFCLSFVYSTTYSQDFNFSQYYNTPINVNPANTGLFKYDYRLGLIYRNQWQGIGDPFTTVMFTGDLNFPTNFLKADNIGAGLMIVNDRSPDGVFVHQLAMASVAVHQHLDDEHRHKIGGGLQAGWGRKSVNTSSFLFGNQVDRFNNQFNSEIPSGEDFSGLNFDYLNLNAGINYSFVATQKSTFYVGGALFNLTQPREGSSSLRVPVRTNVEFSYKYQITPKLHLLPQLLYTQMSATTDLNLALNAGYSFLPKLHKNTLIASLGVGYRLQDATILYGGVRFNNVQIGMSYDLTISNLREVTANFGRRNTLGAWEISIIYVGFLKRGIPSEVSVPCRIF